MSKDWGCLWSSIAFHIITWMMSFLKCHSLFFFLLPFLPLCASPLHVYCIRSGQWCWYPTKCLAGGVIPLLIVLVGKDTNWECDQTSELFFKRCMYRGRSIMAGGSSKLFCIAVHIVWFSGWELCTTNLKACLDRAVFCIRRSLLV